MDSIETVCEVCHGTRYSEEVLKYQYKGKNIAEVMDMTVRQAIQFFEDADFVKKLDTLVQVGLGYLHLNQSMTTLSGGELQRVKLASKLDERGQIFILDEPTDGLHLDDIRRLMKLFNRMTDQGNTAVYHRAQPGCDEGRQTISWSLDRAADSQAGVCSLPGHRRRCWKRSGV